MSTFVLLADNDPGVDLRSWIKLFGSNGKRIAVAAPTPPAPAPDDSLTNEGVVADDAKSPVAAAKKGAAVTAAKKDSTTTTKDEGKQKKRVGGEEKRAAAAGGAGGSGEGVMSLEQKFELIDRQFINLLPNLLANASNDDIETGFALVQHIVGALEAKAQSSIVNKLLSTLTSNPTSATNTKLTLLTALFNSSYLEGPTSAPLRGTIYMALLQLALATGNERLLQGSYDHIEEWINEWKLTKPKQAELYLLLAQITKASADFADSTAFTLKYLKMVEAAGLPLPPAKDVALTAVLAVLSSPAIQAYDEYLNLAAVQQLQSDKKTAHIFQLLKIFAVENVDSYTKLAAEKKDVLAGTGLVHDDVIRKLRTLTISSLGLSSERLTYADLAKKLSLADVNEVESVVIDAVLSGRVDAKLDQDAQLVIIQRTSPRAFSATSWAELGGKLRAWRDNVGKVLDSLEQVQTPPTQSSSH